jgi:hypothetical protein
METAIPAKTPGNAWTRRLRLYGKALLLQESAYREVLLSPAPRKEGFRLLVVLFLTVGVITSLGLALDWMTLPRVDLMQSYVSEFVFNSQIYAAWAAASPTGALIFNAFYQIFWFVLSIEIAIRPHAHRARPHFDGRRRSVPLVHLRPSVNGWRAGWAASPRGTLSGRRWPWPPRRRCFVY